MRISDRDGDRAFSYCAECGFGPLVVPQHAARCGSYLSATDLRAAELEIVKAHIELHGSTPTPEFTREGALQLIAERALEAAR